jgi:primosomal protein N' (replication factor Y)
VIGTRSAIFAPLKNCGVIMVDEEHDISFKQQSGFRYSARDVAVMRAEIAEIPVILGTATPSLETWNNVAKEKYQLLTLSDRAGSAQMPSITLHNICNEKLHYGLSKKLIDAMTRHLNQGNQLLLFLNRRGYAPVLLCHHCGWTAQCLHCDAKVTIHDQPRKLLCHHCGYQFSPPRICPSCKQSELMSLGMGTEQLEKTLATLFADKKICRIDRDTIKNFKTLKSTLQKVHDREVDILIGTQMLVKGHHFENVTLVAALNVDNALFSGDFRAIERLGQSLIQVAGRAGRAEKLGEVFIQTHHPEHPLLKKLFQENYAAFADALLQERLQAQLPPFVSMCLLRAEGKNKTRVHEFLQQVKNQIASDASIEIIGPVAATMEKKAGFYRAQLILQSPHRSLLKNAMALMLQHIEQQKKLSGLRWSIDVDPMEIG